MTTLSQLHEVKKCSNTAVYIPFIYTEYIGSLYNCYLNI